MEEIKKEGTGRRPSVLSEWYRKKLGRDVAISDIDWVITSISNKDVMNRYLVIEEKTISSSEKLLLGLGQSRSLKEVKEDIVKGNISIFVVFIENESISNGAWVYEFNTKHIDDTTNWLKVGDSWYVNVKNYSVFYNENELISKILNKVGSSLK